MKRKRGIEIVEESYPQLKSHLSVVEAIVDRGRINTPNTDGNNQGTP